MVAKLEIERDVAEGEEFDLIRVISGDEEIEVDWADDENIVYTLNESLELAYDALGATEVVAGESLKNWLNQHTDIGVETEGNDLLRFYRVRV